MKDLEFFLPFSSVSLSSTSFFSATSVFVIASNWAILTFQKKRYSICHKGNLQSPATRFLLFKRKRYNHLYNFVSRTVSQNRWQTHLCIKMWQHVWQAVRPRTKCHKLERLHTIRSLSRNCNIWQVCISPSHNWFLCIPAVTYPAKRPGSCMFLSAIWGTSAITDSIFMSPIEISIFQQMLKTVKDQKWEVTLF